MCQFVEKVLSFNKRKCLKEMTLFSFSFFQRYFYLFDASSISDYKRSMHFHVVHTVFVEKTEISCHRNYLEILNPRLSPSTMPLNMFLNSQRNSKLPQNALFCKE